MHTNKLLDLLKVDPSLAGSDRQRNKARPPWVEFHWGKLHSFKAIVERLQIKFTYFASDGMPLRAKADLTLKQFKDEADHAAAEPDLAHPDAAHRAPAQRTARRWTGWPPSTTPTPTRWRLIAEANDVVDPLDAGPRHPAGHPRAAGAPPWLRPASRLDGVVLTVDGRPLPRSCTRGSRWSGSRSRCSCRTTSRSTSTTRTSSCSTRTRSRIGTRIEIAFRAEGDPTVVTSGEVTAVAVEPGASGRHELVLTGFDLTHRLARGAEVAQLPAGHRRRHRQPGSPASTAWTPTWTAPARPTTTCCRPARPTTRSCAGGPPGSASTCGSARRRSTSSGRPRSAGDPAASCAYGREPVQVHRPVLLRRALRRGADPRLGPARQGGRSPAGPTETDPGTDAPGRRRRWPTRPGARSGGCKRNAGQFPVTDQAEADALASSLLLRASGEEVVLRGEAAGDPLIGAGAKVAHRGQSAPGWPATTGSPGSSTLYGAGRPYVTRFVCGGKEPAGLADLTGRRPARPASAAAGAAWSSASSPTTTTRRSWAGSG